jgi:thymidylate kinase
MIILEGPDGCGKSTLAKAIEDKYKAIVIHASYDKSWNIRKLHRNMVWSANMIEASGCPVVFDRWALSEAVYGSVFRGSESYDTKDLVSYTIENYAPLLIYCSNDDVVKNHLRNMQNRSEMYDDMTDVAELYDILVRSGDYGSWLKYDFSKTTIENFMEKIDEYIGRRYKSIYR